MPTTTAAALDALRTCRTNLLAARKAALDAATGLAGARHARAGELADQISDALAHLHRRVRVLDDNEPDELAYRG
jgi:hypothetical protein